MAKFDIFPLPEITYPLTIGTLGITIVTGHEISAHCHNHGCHHKARINLVALAKKVGINHGSQAADLLPYFHCGPCKEAGRPSKNIGFILHAPTDYPMCNIETRRETHRPYNPKDDPV
jgi:hypothetical protein